MASNSNENVIYLSDSSDDSLKRQQYIEENRIFKAAREGNIVEIEQLLNSGIAVDKQDSREQFTALHLATKCGHFDVIKMLVNHGADIHKTNKSLRVPLHMAAEYGDVDILKYFLDKDVVIDVQDKLRRTPLYYASCENKLDAVKMLLERNANPKISFSYPNNLSEEKLIEFINLAPNILSNDKVNEDMLIEASLKNYINVVDILLKTDVNVNAEGSWFFYKSPLHSAASEGNNNIIVKLINNNANINAKSNENNSPIHEAAEKGHLQTIKLLLENGANINDKGIWDITPLMDAVIIGSYEIVQYLLDNGADILSVSTEYIDDETEENEENFEENQETKDKKPVINSLQTALHYAIQGEHKSIIELLIKRGAVINFPGKFAPIHLALIYSMNDVIQMLLDNGADINAKCENLWTPLHYAYNRFFYKNNTIEFLLQKGADTTCRNIDNKLPIENIIETINISI